MAMERPIVPSNPAPVTVPSMAAVQANGTSLINGAKAGATAPKPKKPRKTRAQKTQKQNAHFEVVIEAAWAVTQILSAHGLSCAIFGSLASKLYGCPRIPKDVDLLVSQEDDEEVTADSEDPSIPSPLKRKPRLTPEEIKDIILRTNSQNFYLKMPRDPAAEYRILWYRQKYQGPECKVDILVPGIMHLPFIKPDGVVWIENLPLVPFALLLYQKLQGWDDHCKAELAHYKRRQQQDAADVAKLLRLKDWMGSLKGSNLLEDTELFGEEFKALTEERVKLYCEAFKDREKDWKQLGFETS